MRCLPGQTEGTPDDEAEAIVERMKQRMADGVDPSDMAVLFRYRM